MSATATASVESSDEALLDLLKRLGPQSVPALGRGMGVTATAVRQRLARLSEKGLVRREAVRAARGRPGHRYMLTEKGRRQVGSNFTDLALVLWKEIREIKDREVRVGMLRRIAQSLGVMYTGEVQGTNTAERMESLARLFDDRAVAFQVEKSGDLPVLTAVACPYPELAERDRTICAVEKMLFSDLLGENVRLTDYRLEGANCCRFETG